MISCADFVADIGNYLDDDVAEDVRRKLEAHLAHCVHCTVLVDSMRKTVKVVTDTETFDLLPDVLETVSKRIMAKIREGR